MTSQQPAPMSDLMRNLTDAAGRLIRQEVRQGQEEMKDKARQSVPGMIMLGAAGVCGAAAAGTATVMLVRVLEKVLPRTAAAGLATVALGGAAAALGVAGLEEIRRVRPVPDQTLRSIRADVDAATRSAQTSRTIDVPPSE